MLSDILEVMDKNKQAIGDEIRQALHEQSFIGLCPTCGGNLRVLRSRKGSEFIGCSGYPDCKRAFPKPRGALVQTTDQLCEVCKLPKVRVIRRGSPPAVICIDPECETNRETTTVGQCPLCGKDLRILYSRFGKRFIGCSGYPDCKRTYPLPQLGTVYSTGNKCEVCGARSWQFCADMDCVSNKRAKKEKEGDAGESKKTVPKKAAKKKTPAKKAAVKKALASGEDAPETSRRAVVEVGFHSLRHSFVSLCAANRVPQVAIQDLVGHGSPAMTALYSHADFQQKQDAINGLPTMVFEKQEQNR